MSKVKSPREKKRLSLARDRRNAYGESTKGARKNIPKRKAKTRQVERHAVSQELGQARKSTTVDSLEAIEGKALSLGRLKRLSGFKKTPDVPLEVSIKNKRATRNARTERNRLKSRRKVRSN